MPPYNAPRTTAKDFQGKWRREGAFMPYGSTCNMIGLALQGRGEITRKELDSLKTAVEELSELAYAKAKKFIQDGLREEKVSEQGERVNLPQ